MEIIILGFVLFILGVGGTIVHDKHKANLAKAAEARAARASAPRKSQKDMIQEMLGMSSIPVYTSKTTTRTTTKPLSQKKKLKGPVTNDDVSINSTLTVEELIAKIESMKRPGPKK